MNRTLGLACAAALGAFVLSAPVAGHHSFAAAYNMQDPITIKGKIVNVRMTNPHAYFFLDVDGENGEVIRWSFEAGTPSGMIRNGYSPQVIKAGDVVTVSGFRAKDATKPNGMLAELVVADGTVYGMFGPRQGPAAR